MSQEEQVRRQIVELLPRLRRFARTIARNVHDADDLVQLAIERALLKHDQWRPELKFDGWMFGIMRNAWIDEVRSRARRDRIFAPEEAGVTVGHVTLIEDLADRVAQDLAHPEPGFRQHIVVVADIDGAIQIAAGAFAVARFGVDDSTF